MDGSISFQGGFVMNNVRKITVDEWKNIPAGAAVHDGFGGSPYRTICPFWKEPVKEKKKP